MAVFFLLMLAFVVGTGILVHSLLSTYEGYVNQAATLDRMRTTSQLLAVRAMRLTDDDLAQIGELGQDIQVLDRALYALTQGGVVDDREVAALAQPETRDFLPRIRGDWQALRARLQTVMLSSYTGDEDPVMQPDLSRKAWRQWIAVDSATLLETLDACAGVLRPLLQQEKDRALVLGGVLLLFGLLLLLSAYWLARRHLILPLREMRLACTDLMEGKYDARISYRGLREFSEIARTFNAGAQYIRGLLDSLRHEHMDLERSDTIFKGLAQNSIVGIFLVEHDRFSFVSDKMAEIFGYAPDEMIAKLPLLALIVPRERHLVAEAIKASQSRSDGTMRFERHGRCKNGSVIDIEVFSTTLWVGDQVAIIGLVQDITQRKQAESSAQLARIAYENSSEAIVVTNPTGVVMDVNPAFSRITGYRPEEVIGDLLQLLQPGRHNRDFYDDMWHLINTRGRWDGEYWCQRKSGERYALRAVLDTAWNPDGSVNCRVAMLSDITQKKQMETRIWNQAHHDPLTNLPNRQYFNERLRTAVEASRRTARPLALLFLDLDLFKEINDSMGHAVGDHLLVEVADRLRERVASDSRFVARLGGDEFVVIVSDAPDRAQIDLLCQTILDCITQPYTLGGEPLRISASLGVARYPEDADSAEALLRHVDMAMYVAKDAGRNRFHHFDQGMRQRARMRRDLLYALPQAIDAAQFFLLYQPIRSFRTGRIIQAEVLLRWRHPEFGVIAPLDFIPFAEERQLIQPLGAWVFREAAGQLARWRRVLAPDLRLTLNASPGQFSLDGSGLETILGLLDRIALPPDSLSLEFSESVLTGLDPQVHQQLQRLHAAGMRFSVGSVSVGLPALLSAHGLPFETLKLEREATEQLLGSEQAHLVCEAIIALAHRLGMQVIAEGITSQAQYQLLYRVGCDAGQGYWFDAPLVQTEFEQRLRTPASMPFSPPDAAAG